MKKTEKKLQVYLPNQDYQLLRDRAATEGVSMAEVMRRSFKSYVDRDNRSVEEIRAGYRRLRALVGSIHDGANVAEEHDKYAWGDP